MLTPCCFIQEVTLIHKKENNKHFYSVKLIFQDNWEDYLKNHKVREIERVEVERFYPAKTIAEEDFGIIARIAKNICLFHLVAILDYALAVAKDILTNGHRCWLIS